MGMAGWIALQAADVSDYMKISEAIKESHMWKPIDVLICNAGFVRSEYLENTSIEDLDLIIQTNLTGTLYTFILFVSLSHLRKIAMAD